MTVRKRPAWTGGTPARGKNGRIGPNGTIQAANGEGARANKLPPSADTAVQLLRDIKEKRLDPHDLTTENRRACLLLMANGTQTSAEMAALFGVTPSCVRMDLKRIREAVGREVRDLTLEEVLGEVTLAKDKCAAHAMRHDDPGLAWTITRDYAKLLKEFGVVGTPEGADSLSITIQALGDGYERARTVLAQALDPRLTGEVINVDAEVIDAPAIPALALGEHLPGTPEGPSGGQGPPGDDDLDLGAR